MFNLKFKIMKKVLIIFILLLSFVGFANRSVEYKDYEIRILNSEIQKKNVDFVEYQECYAICSINVINTETGATQTVSGFGHSYLSCSQAGTACLADANAKAKKLVAELNAGE